ncbi:MAG: PEP-utilizing enzyme [Acidimicrobiales bacterium]
MTNAAPGPGQWALDTGHFPRPATRFTAELFPEPSKKGFADGTAPFGLLLDFLEWAFVEGWSYLSPRPVPALRQAAPPTRSAWDDLVRSSPELEARLAVSARVFEDRAWRHDLALWDLELKPSLVAGHIRVQATDPAGLSDTALLAHLDQCRENLCTAIWAHHRFNVTPVLPVGELLARCREWTDASAVDVLGLLRGAGPLAVGASDELARAADAIRADTPSHAAVSSSADAAEVLASLLVRPGSVGEAVSAYFDLVGNWSAGHGFDIDEPTLLEMPGLLVESLRVAVAGDTRAEAGDDAVDRAAELRRAVPVANRTEFDDTLAEARLVHRLRDERALYCDVWANGLMRRAVVAAGSRLAERGLIRAPVLLVEATYSEMRSLLLGDGGSSAVTAAAPALADDLATRATCRGNADPATVAPVLGHSSRSPVPTDWLPPGAARTERAFRTYLGAMDDDDDDDSSSESTVRGVPASAGVFEGRARIVHGADGIGSIRNGDVLVTEATSPAFNIVLPLIGAIVTDRGGMLSHAAIVAREYAIPAVVGTEVATRRIPDGARVRVDGGSGEAIVLPS